MHYLTVIITYDSLFIVALQKTEYAVKTVKMLEVTA